MDDKRDLILALDTSMATCSAALVMGDEILRARAWRADRRHSAHLEPNVRSLLGDDLGSVGVVAVSAGPGGFSSLRTSMAFAKGLCLALGLKFVAVPASLALAYSAPADAKSLLTLIATGNDGYYVQSFQRRGDRVEAQGACELLRPADIHHLAGARTTLVGDVRETDIARIRELSGAEIKHHSPPLEDGLAPLVGRAATDLLGENEVRDLIGAVPIYVRGADITSPAHGWGRA